MNKKFILGIVVILFTMLLVQGAAAAVEIQIDGSGSNDAQTVQAGSTVSLTVRARDTSASNPFNITVANATLNMTGGAWTFSPDIATTPEVLVNATAWTNFTLNVTVPNMAPEDSEFKFNLFAAQSNDTTNNDTIRETMTVGDTERITVVPSTTTDNLPARGLGIYQLTITNNGPNTENITLTATKPTDWAVEFNDSELLNVPSLGARNVWMRVDVGGDASVGSKYPVNPKVSADTTDVNQTEINITIAAPIDLGNATQEARVWLESQVAAGNWGIDAEDAWAMWAYKNVYGNNNTIVSDTEIHINSTQLGNGRWTDAGITGLMVYSLLWAGYTQGNTDDWDEGGIRNATDYLLTQVNQSKNSPDTSMMLAAIFKADKDGGYANVNSNANVTDALNWLKNNQSADGSYGGTVPNTAFALLALEEAIDNGKSGLGTVRTNAENWLKDQQAMNGSFGDGSHILDTAITLVALREGGESEDSTWTVDPDGNGSTTDDQFEGGMWRAIYFISQDQNNNGGWGSLPSTVITTSLGTIALGGGGMGTGYGTIKGTVSGAGAASAETPNATLTFKEDTTSETVTVQANSTGQYIVSLAAGQWDLTVTHADYHTEHIDNIVLSAGQSKTQNVDMNPTIEVAIFPASATVNENQTLSYNGTATYKFNGADIGTGTSNVKVKYNTKLLDTANTNSDGKFSDSFKANLAAKATNYAIKVNVSKSDSWGIATISLKVNALSDTSPPAGGPGGSGGSGTYDIRITSYDQKVTVAQGETKTVQVVVKNYGAESLEDVSLSISGITSSWYTVNTTGGSSVEDLSTDEIVTFNVKFDIPDNAEAKTYEGAWKAKDKNNHASVQKTMNLTITELWTQTTVTDLSSEVSGLETEFADLNSQIAGLEAEGKDVTSLLDDLAELNETIQKASDAYAAGQYSQAETHIATANALISSIESTLAGLGAGAGKDDTGFTFGWALIAAIIVAAAGGAVGVFILWYKFMRITSISAIKEAPGQFGEGTRIEGVVKSVTETKKGKVFLISDDSGKLHVRYPYYTTLNKGDTLRAAGAIKTYKKVPYMDASDVARVSITHKH